MSVRIVNEGILTDIYDLVTTPAQDNSSRGNPVVDNALGPMDSEDLFYAIIDQLKDQQTRRSSPKLNKAGDAYNKGNLKPSTITKKSTEFFFPKNDKVPKDTHPKLFNEYRYKFENIIIDFITKGAVDIIKKVQDSYKKKLGKEYSPKAIEWEVYFGTILTYMWQPKYKLVDQIAALWSEFNKVKKQDPWKDYKGDSEEIKTNSKNNKLYKDALELAKEYRPSNPEDAREFDEFIRNAEGKTASEIATRGAADYFNSKKN